MKNQWYLLVTKQELREMRKNVFSLQRCGHMVRITKTPSLSVEVNGEKWPHILEHGDSVWICFSNTPVTFMPFWPELFNDNKPYEYCELQRTVRSQVEPILENFIDCTHTGFVHDGILRGYPSQKVEATISTTPRGVLIKTIGEKMASATVTKLFNYKHTDVYHTDELILPHTVRVEYVFGKKHVVASSICAPIDDERTMIYTRVYLKWPFFRKIVLMYLKYSTSVILDQDKIILEDQDQNLKIFGNLFRLKIAADAGAIAIRRAWNQFTTTGEVASARSVKITLKI